MLELRPYQREVFNKIKSRLKETSDPLLVNASVGSGKSLIIAELLLTIEQAGWRALCLTMNSSLIKQNVKAYRGQGGNCGIFCAALNQKDIEDPVIFASPISVRNDIKNEGEFSRVPFNLIVIDECHNVNIREPSTSYMMIFNWYSKLSKELGHKIRFVGLTGTPFRGKGHSIVGPDQFFKEEVCSISAHWLINKGYLTKPLWGCSSNQYDFDSIHLDSMGRFDASALQTAVKKEPRLTAKIMFEVQEIVKDRRGAFIFATSREHCQECADALPSHLTAIITSETPYEKRELYIAKAKAGEIKYLVNINVFCVGIDIPQFDTVVFVRPTESLVLYMQCIGRGLRLFEGKNDCLVLDYAGNLDRHGDIDNPVINEALKPTSQDDPDYCIPCYSCQTMNKITARRCIGTIDNKRCDHYFDFKECFSCKSLNDKTARYCRSCKIELIDPNKKLQAASKKNLKIFNVVGAEYWTINSRFYPIFCAKYTISDEEFGDKKYTVGEYFHTSSPKSKNFFYATFIKKHLETPSEAYPNLTNNAYLTKIIQEGKIITPRQIVIKKSNGQYQVAKKIFEDQLEQQAG